MSARSFAVCLLAGVLSASVAVPVHADPRERQHLHVGGGMTWRSDPAAEWDETVAKASGPLRAIGGVEAAENG